MIFDDKEEVTVIAQTTPYFVTILANMCLCDSISFLANKHVTVLSLRELG